MGDHQAPALYRSHERSGESGGAARAPHPPLPPTPLPPTQQPSSSAASVLKLMCTVGLVALATTGRGLAALGGPGSGPGAGGAAGSSPLRSSRTSSSDTHKSAAAAAAAAAASVCGGLPACTEWHRSPSVRALNLSIILVGNEAYQQFPLLGYGGIETSVQNIAAGLHAMRIPFAAVVPKRTAPVPLPAYPFPIYDTEAYSNGKGNVKDAFVHQTSQIIADLHRATASPEKDAARGAAKSGGGVDNARADAGVGHTFAVWGQSVWAQAFAAAPGVALAIVSHHDGNGPPRAGGGGGGGGVGAGGDGWDAGMHTARHRFLSDDQRSRWVHVDDPRRPQTRVIPHGLPPAEFFTCDEEEEEEEEEGKGGGGIRKLGKESGVGRKVRGGGYFLWVASLDWGWEQKGMAIFVELARRRPGLKFVAYGGAVMRHDLVDRAKQVSEELPNFDFRGTLGRTADGAHSRAFCRARGFLMPTQPDIGESFGMTVIESLSKGVPVIASTAAAVPELLGIPFGHERRARTAVGAACETIEDYLAAVDALAAQGPRTREKATEIMEWARARYSSGAVVDALLAFTLQTARELGVLPARERGMGRPAEGGVAASAELRRRPE